jgi:hypothetical protein
MTMKRIESGVMVMLGDRAWGIEYEDGHSTCYGWVDPCLAPIHDPRFCREPIAVTYPGSHDTEELKKGRIVSVRRVTSVETFEG